MSYSNKVAGLARQFARVLADGGVSIYASGSRLENNKGSHLKNRTGSGGRSGSTRKAALPISAWVIP